jgi:hypothetical protein
MILPFFFIFISTISSNLYQARPWFEVRASSALACHAHSLEAGKCTHPDGCGQIFLFSFLDSFFDIFFVSSLRPRVSLRPACLLWLLFFQWSFIIIISQHNSFFGPGAHTFCGLLNLLRTVEGNAVPNQPTLYSTCFRTWESQLVSFSSRDFAGTHF